MTRASDTARLIGAGATINDGTTITTADNTAQLELVSTDADSGIGPHQVFYRNSSSPADSDLLCELDFRGRNDNSQDVNYATVNVKANDVTDGEEDGEYILQVMTAGSVDTTMHIKPAEIVFNEDSIDRDFRVESNGNANMLVVDGGNDKIGIGTNSPVADLHLAENASDVRIAFTTDQTGNTVSDGTFIGVTDGGNFQIFNRENAAIMFSTNGSERFRILHDGRMAQGRTSAIDGEHFTQAYDSVNGAGMMLHSTDTSGNNHNQIRFRRNVGDVGSISTTSSATAYNTSSDYRLKENVSYDFDATSRLKQLKPARFNFKVDKNKTVDGFLAHEVSDVVPEAIIGEKDATETYTDDDGNEQTIIKPQAIDQSKLVPLLVKTIQELEARIATLESK